MPRDEQTVLVKPLDGHMGLMYQVESWTTPDQPHIVDLSRFDGNGECSCTNWQCRVGPAIKAGAILFSKQATCRHTRAAHRYWLKAALKAYVTAHQQQRHHE